LAKIFLFASIPPQLIKGKKIEAAHYRSWQFFEPLLQDGHTILYCTALPPEELPQIPAEWNRMTFLPLNPRRIGWIRQMQQAYDKFQPDCTVAVNFDSSLYASRLKTEKPIWMDIYGDYLTIIQAARFRVQTDRGIGTAVNFMRDILLRGDKFSVCSPAQRHMLIGELAMTGRLNKKTFAYEFADIILPGSVPTAPFPENAADRQVLTSLGIAYDDFVVLWCGGYNAWTDVETLFSGLETAMKQNKKVHFVSVGEYIYKRTENTYTHFKEMVENSAFRDRYHLLGWKPWEEIPPLYRESDVGINIDSPIYETLFGTRTRIVEMIAYGLPVVTSLGTDLSYFLCTQEGGMGFEIGSSVSLSEQLLKLANNKELCLRLSRKATQVAREELSFYKTTLPLREWVQNPVCAPDRLVSSSEKRQQVEYRMRSWFRNLIWKISGLDR